MKKILKDFFKNDFDEKKSILKIRNDLFFNNLNLNLPKQQGLIIQSQNSDSKYPMVLSFTIDINFKKNHGTLLIFIFYRFIKELNGHFHQYNNSLNSSNKLENLENFYTNLKSELLNWISKNFDIRAIVKNNKFKTSEPKKFNPKIFDDINKYIKYFYEKDIKIDFSKLLSMESLNKDISILKDETLNNQNLELIKDKNLNIFHLFSEFLKLLNKSTQNCEVTLIEHRKIIKSDDELVSYFLSNEGIEMHIIDHKKMKDLLILFNFKSSLIANLKQIKSKNRNSSNEILFNLGNKDNSKITRGSFLKNELIFKQNGRKVNWIKLNKEYRKNLIKKIEMELDLYMKNSLTSKNISKTISNDYISNEFKIKLYDKSNEIDTKIKIIFEDLIKTIDSASALKVKFNYAAKNELTNKQYNQNKEVNSIDSNSISSSLVKFYKNITNFLEDKNSNEILKNFNIKEDQKFINYFTILLLSKIYRNYKSVSFNDDIDYSERQICEREIYTKLWEDINNNPKLKRFKGVKKSNTNSSNRSITKKNIGENKNPENWQVILKGSPGQMIELEEWLEILSILKKNKFFLIK